MNAFPAKNHKAFSDGIESLFTHQLNHRLFISRLETEYADLSNQHECFFLGLLALRISLIKSVEFA